MRGFLPANLFYKRCLVLKLFDAYQLRKKIFFLLGLSFTPPYLRIYEGIFASHFSAGGDGHEHHLKNIFCGGLTLTPSNVRICERTFPRQKLISKLPSGDGQKHHLKEFQKFFLKLGLQKGG